MRGKAKRGNEISFGDYGLQALEPTWITSRQIEAARRTITRYTKRGASLWIRIFPDRTVTARAAESRMGSGKGAVDYWVAVIKPGTILFEIASVPEEIARSALNLAAYRLSNHSTSGDVRVILVGILSSSSKIPSLSLSQSDELPLSSSN